jgi:hypothetical protein
MRPQEQEITRLGKEYGKLANNFPTEVRNSVPRNNTFNIGTARAREAKTLVSKVPQLYRLIQKNAQSFVNNHLNFPAIPLDRKKRVQFPTANVTYATLLRHERSLLTLADAKLDDTDSNGNTVHSCLSSLDGGYTEHTYLNKMKSLKGFEPQDIEKLAHCQNQKCTDCIDCHRHQDELYKALSGIWDDNDQEGNKRGLHIKNLISTLNSWSSHLDSRGNDMNSASDKQYLKCRNNHQLLATSMRHIARQLENAIEKDGVGVHEDPIYGDDKGPGY